MRDKDWLILNFNLRCNQHNIHTVCFDKRWGDVFRALPTELYSISSCCSRTRTCDHVFNI